MKLSLTCFLCCLVFIPTCSLCSNSKKIWNWNSIENRGNDGYHGDQYKEDPDILMNVVSSLNC